MSMTEIVLNALLNLFALRAASAPQNFRDAVRERAVFYLREHLGLDAIAPYIELYDLALDMQRQASSGLLLERGAAVAAGLRTQLPRVEQFTILSMLLEAVPEDASSENALLRTVAEAFSVERNYLDGYALFSGSAFPWNGVGLDDRFLLPTDSARRKRVLFVSAQSPSSVQRSIRDLPRGGRRTMLYQGILRERALSGRVSPSKEVSAS